MKRRILEECVKMARNKMADHPEWGCYLHFSFLVQDGKIHGCGYNRAGTPLIGWPSYGKIHAEADVWFGVKGIIDQDQPFSIVNVRLTKSNGSLKISKPCPCCVRFLKKFGCKEVWFSTEAGFARLYL